MKMKNVKMYMIKFINIAMPDEEHILITVCQDVSYHIKLEWICINAYN